MRRCKDDWVNATQILKCCNFPKARRTKILEKGVQLGLHEKVQGGFGRFQGTWVPLLDAQRLAATYGLLPHQAPVLHLDLSDPNLKFEPRPRPPPKDPTPVKRKYTKKIKPSLETPTKRSRGHLIDTSMDLNDTSTASFSSMNASFTDNSQSSFIPINNHDMLPPRSFTTSNGYSSNLNNDSFKSNLSQPYFSGSAKSAEPPTFQPPRSSFHQYQLSVPASQQQQQQQNQIQNHNQQHQAHLQHHNQHQFTKHNQHHQPQLDLFQGAMPHSGVFLSNSSLQTQYMPHNYLFPDKLNSLSTIESSHDDMSKPHTKDSDTSLSSAEDHHSKAAFYRDASKVPMSKPYAAQLLRFFSDDSQPIPQFLYTMPADFNIDQAIDDEGHTALHWAASIGNFNMIHLLLAKGANPLIVNNFGLNPLSKLILFNNCSEMRNFDRVLGELETCLIHTDINGRTPLHYLMEFAKTSSKRNSLGYYLDIILYKLHAMSDANLSSKVDLVRNVLDHRDVNGDTCLHLAIKSGTIEFYKLLTQHGARDDLANSNKETARFLMSQLGFNEPLNQNNLLQMLQHPLSQDLALEVHPQPQIFINDRPAQVAFAAKPQQNHSFIMETPVQGIADTPVQGIADTPVQAIVDTPDTHKTMIARAESEDESETVHSSVSNRQLESLQRMDETGSLTPVTSKENKENIFLGSALPKTTPTASTPQRASYHPSNSAQPPLPAISEHTAESTPIKDTSSNLKPVCRVTHLPRPPQLDSKGRLITRDGEQEVHPKASLLGISTMVLGMMHSLEDCYAKETEDLENTIQRLTEEAAHKQAQKDASLEDLQQKLMNSGFDCPTSFTAASKAIDEASSKCQEELERLNSQVQRSLSNLYTERVTQCLDDSPELEESDSSGNLAALAIKLTELQRRQDTLLQRYAEGIMSYGADDKMYKFRKLIGLSCGVRVEEVDLLIDRILVHLMESGSQ